MSNEGERKGHDNSNDLEQDLSAGGIVEGSNLATDYFTLPHHRAAGDDTDSIEGSPSPPARRTSRFFVGARGGHTQQQSEQSESDVPFSPIAPGIAITSHDDDVARPGYDSQDTGSFTSDGPSELQARGQLDPYANQLSPGGDVPPSVRSFSSMSNLSGVYNTYGEPLRSPLDSPTLESPCSPRLGGGIAARRPGLNPMYSSPYMPHINSINFQSSANPLLAPSPASPMSPMLTPTLPGQRSGASGGFSRNALASPPPRMLHTSVSVPTLRNGRLHRNDGLRPGSPFGVSRKPVPTLRRQRSTALPDHDEYMKEGEKKGKKKKPQYCNPHDSPVPKPWLKERDRKVLWSRLLTYAGALLGAALAALVCYFGYTSVKMVGTVCLVLDEDFSGTQLNSTTWLQEAEMGGFGNGQFEMTTTSSNNTFIDNGILYLVPTLTADNIGNDSVWNGHIYNLTGCTSPNVTACSAVSNDTTRTIINPVQSARIATRVNGSTTSITYGRVEVRARLPEGDWLWPAIWMLPVNNTYGKWPVSGEIDIMESRGNNKSYPDQGDNYVRGSLNWGPNDFINSVAKTFGWFRERRKSFNEGFHTYTLEWTDQFLRIYIDSRLQKMLYVDFAKESFFQRGKYPKNAWNGTQEVPIANPWAGRGNSAPFDEAFYLILNVAVGGTNGWFPDGAGGKPWLDGSPTAMTEFAAAQDQWYPTWPTDPKTRGMAVESVKMWQKC